MPGSTSYRDSLQAKAGVGRIQGHQGKVAQKTHGASLEAYEKGYAEGLAKFRAAEERRRL
jgi:hypothetical protein